jgi:PAS domain S-box-containing protein
MSIKSRAHKADSSWSRDLLVATLITLGVSCFLVYVDGFDKLHGLLAPYEHWELDEIVLGLATATITLLWFAWRRWMEARKALSLRVEAHGLLRKSNEELSILTSAVPGVLYICEPNQEFTATYVSASVKGHLGYEPAAFTANPKFWSDNLHPEDKNRVLASLKELGESANNVQEYRFLHADNSYRWIHDQRSLLFDSNGKAERLVGVLVDITAQKQIEEAFQISEQRFKAIFDNVPAALFLKGIDGRYKLINKRYAEWFRIESDAIVGKSVHDLYPKERADQYADGDRKVLATGEIDSEDVEIPLPSGETRNFTLTKFPIWDGTRIQGIGSVMVDITEREQALREMRTAMELAEEAGKAKSEFITNMNHELRTPLTSIKGSLGLAQNGMVSEVPAELRAMLDIAYRNSMRLENLINDVLDIQKIEAGQMDFATRPLTATTLVETAVEANKGYGESYDVRFVTKTDEGDYHVEANEDRLMQVFANLLSNAAKFSIAGSTVEVAVSRVHGKVRFSVTDLGCGIPASFREKIFDRFSQLDSSDARQTGGTGLGLNIAKSIVEMHGGSIDFKSEVGHGTVFYFDLPELRNPPPTLEIISNEPKTGFA